MDALVSRALMIRLSLQPSPDSETSAFSNIRAFSTRCAELFPFRISASSRSRSSALNRTTYLFTEISFAAMIASVVHAADEANHQILSIWLKRATSARIRTGDFLDRVHDNGENRPVRPWCRTGVSESNRTRLATAGTFAY